MFLGTVMETMCGHTVLQALPAVAYGRAGESPTTVAEPCMAVADMSGRRRCRCERSLVDFADWQDRKFVADEDPLWNLVVREALATPALQIGAGWRSPVAGGDEGVADLVVDGVADRDDGGDADQWV